MNFKSQYGTFDRKLRKSRLCAENTSFFRFKLMTSLSNGLFPIYEAGVIVVEKSDN